MTIIRIELSDDIAQAARDAGLLTPQSLERLLTEALHRPPSAALTKSNVRTRPGEGAGVLA